MNMHENKMENNKKRKLKKYKKKKLFYSSVGLVCIFKS